MAGTMATRSPAFKAAFVWPRLRASSSLMKMRM
jgi:hypothetical protein